MLAHALNGRRGWQDALRALPETGRELQVSGGEAGGESFYVAAILGAPTLWANARETVRRGKLRLAAQRAFKGRLRFTLDDGKRRKDEALTLMCPLVSRGLQRDTGLEAAAPNPKDALEDASLGPSTLVGGWRNDPAVQVEVCQRSKAWVHGRAPTILDGEPHRLTSPVSISYQPRACRAVVPADCEVLLKRREVAEAPFSTSGAEDGASTSGVH